MRDCPKCYTAVDGQTCPKCGYSEKSAPIYRPQKPFVAADPAVIREVMEKARRIGRGPADPRAWAREILELAKRGEYRYLYGIECAKEALGIGRDLEAESERAAMRT